MKAARLLLMKAAQTSLRSILFLSVLIISQAPAAAAPPPNVKASSEPIASSAAPEDLLFGSKSNGDGTYTTKNFPVGLVKMAPGALGNSANLWRMTAVNMALLNRNGPVNVVCFGDSTSEYARSPGHPILDTLCNAFGTYETDTFDSPNSFWGWPTFAGGANWANADANFHTPYFTLPAGASITITNYHNPMGNGGNMILQGIELFWIVQPTSSFKLQSNRSGSWADETPTIDASGASKNFQSTNVLFTPNNVSSCQIRIVGISGTSFLPVPGYIRSLNNFSDKIRYVNYGQGGYGLDALMCNSNTAWTCFKTMAPDLFIFKMDHEQSWTGANLGNLLSLLYWVTNSTPTCEVLLVGTPPAVADPFFDLGNKTLAGLAGTNFMFADLASQLPMTNWPAVNNGGLYMSGDNLHFSAGGYWSMLAPFFSYWGWPVNLPPGKQAIANIARAQRLQIGPAVNSDPSVALLVSGSYSGGGLGVKPEIGGPGVSLQNNGQDFIYASGGALWERFTYKLDLLASGATAGGYTPSGGAYFGSSPGDSLGPGNLTLSGNYLLLNTNKSTPRFLARGGAGFPAGIYFDTHAIVDSAGVNAPKGLAIDANAGFLDNGTFGTMDPTSTGWQLDFQTATATDQVNLNHAPAGGAMRFPPPFAWKGNNADIVSYGSNTWNGAQNFAGEFRANGGPGAAGQVLTSGGPGAAPAWASVSRNFSGVSIYHDLAGAEIFTTMSGTVEIAMPFAWTSTSLAIEVSGYDLSTGGAWKILAGGYNAGSAWQFPSAKFLGTAPPFSSARLAFHSGHCVLLLGTMSTAWNFSTFAVSQVIAGLNNQTGLDTGWSISILANETGITAATANLGP